MSDETVCRVTDEEFARAKAEADHVVITESALDGQEVALAFRPRPVYPKAFRYFELYRQRRVSVPARTSKGIQSSRDR
jgi:hypothetical protein